MLQRAQVHELTYAWLCIAQFRLKCHCTLGLGCGKDQVAGQLPAVLLAIAGGM
jgi:hypothetical protein